MRVVKTIKHLRQILSQARRKGQKIGFVPTMGYLHEGHLSLMRQAKKECDICVVSIYVNPKQFGPKEDFKRYPRDIKRDATMIKKENVDILFIPSDNDIYPNSYLTYIDVEKISNTLCGKYQARAFQRGGDDRGQTFEYGRIRISCIWGKKTRSRWWCLRQMVADLNFPVSDSRGANSP